VRALALLVLVLLCAGCKPSKEWAEQACANHGGFRNYSQMPSGSWVVVCRDGSVVV
jgi:hypothetical protein